VKLYIFAGPNGSGKTTFAGQFLPNYLKCHNYLNADVIAAKLSPLSPNRAAIQAGRMMFEEMRVLTEQGSDFAFETTLSGKTYFHFLKNVKKQGYHIHLFFLWIRSTDILLERIAGRVRRGGHNVPKEIVRRRFNRGLTNLFQLYRPLLDFWAIYDNSTDTPALIAFEEFGKTEIADPELFRTVTGFIGNKEGSHKGC